jgi:hypothetical protein
MDFCLTHIISESENTLVMEPVEGFDPVRLGSKSRNESMANAYNQ